MAGKKGGGRPPARAASPLNEALRRVQEMVGRGFVPARVGREVEGIVAGWRAEGQGDLVEELLEQLQAGVEAASDSMAELDPDSKAAMRAGENALAALTAARDAARQDAGVPALG
ncbi:hypothetical protein M0638_09010 [Roseomonas sp. NAR14]|uniref:Uncharacterized protein n=1 Tax=Roseomonas acroporae TaxID=2937791 RepID=A0A9X1Y6K9_9PROT|nr:hypothetical protein [Roseomonas acroporae]MCK8784518.1 hypothetical protein [Roseomonas acroporae]